MGRLVILAAEFMKHLKGCGVVVGGFGMQWRDKKASN